MIIQSHFEDFFQQWGFYPYIWVNKKILLREHKRHTARRISSTPSAVLSRGMGKGANPILGQIRMVGYPPPPPGRVPPRTGQHMEYFKSGSRYASCAHAGGLSCYRILSLIYVDTKFVINGIIPSEKKSVVFFWHKTRWKRKNYGSVVKVEQ